MSAGVILGTIGIVAAVIGLGVLIDRKWSILPRKGELAKIDPKAPAPDPAGTTPGAALRLTQAKLERALEAQRCTACQGRLAAGPGETVRYGAGELQVFRLTCSKCGASRALYVDVVAA
jgi:hypothetical protein